MIIGLILNTNLVEWASGIDGRGTGKIKNRKDKKNRKDSLLLLLTNLKSINYGKFNRALF